MKGDFLNWTNRNIECLIGHKEVLKKNNLNIIYDFNKGLAIYLSEYQSIMMITLEDPASCKT